VVLASAAFDVAAAKVHIECSAVRGGGYGQAEEPLILVERRDIPAGRGELLGRQQRVVAAGHEGGEGERAARAILRLVGAARVHGLRGEVRAHALLLVQERARRRAGGRALLVAERGRFVRREDARVRA